jgi:hypothetical protein
MTPHTTIEDALLDGYLVAPRERTTDGLYAAWQQGCREREVPCCRVRLASGGTGGSVCVGWPPLNRPSRACQDRHRDLCEWAVSTNAKPTDFQVCRHELYVSYLDESDIPGFIKEVVALWEARS